MRAGALPLLAATAAPEEPAEKVAEATFAVDVESEVARSCAERIATALERASRRITGRDHPCGADCPLHIDHHLNRPRVPYAGVDDPVETFFTSGIPHNDVTQIVTVERPLETPGRYVRPVPADTRRHQRIGDDVLKKR